MIFIRLDQISKRQGKDDRGALRGVRSPIDCNRDCSVTELNIKGDLESYLDRVFKLKPPLLHRRWRIATLERDRLAAEP
jgi:hypothetical protein